MDWPACTCLSVHSLKRPHIHSLHTHSTHNKCIHNLSLTTQTLSINQQTKTFSGIHLSLSLRKSSLSFSRFSLTITTYRLHFTIKATTHPPFHHHTNHLPSSPTHNPETSPFIQKHADEPNPYPLLCFHRRSTITQTTTTNPKKCS